MIVAAAPAYADDELWGAIAYSPLDGAGTSSQQSKESDAGNAAVVDCGTNGGAGCHVIVTVKKRKDKGLPPPDLFGVAEDDLLFALPSDAIREFVNGKFPGWHELREECRASEGLGPSDSVDWKTYAKTQYGLPLTSDGVRSIVRALDLAGVELPSIRGVVASGIRMVSAVPETSYAPCGDLSLGQVFGDGPVELVFIGPFRFRVSIPKSRTRNRPRLSSRMSTPHDCDSVPGQLRWVDIRTDAGPSRHVQWVLSGGPYTMASQVRQCQEVCSPPPWPRQATWPTRTWLTPRGCPLGHRVGGWVIHSPRVV